MNQKTISGDSALTSEDVWAVAYDNKQIEKNDQQVNPLKGNFPMSQLDALREQLIRKNRILADLKRQLIGAQNSLAQLQCMTDPNVMATLQIRENVTGQDSSMVERAARSMVEVDSCCDRMSYLVKQLQKTTLSIKF